MCQHPGMKRRPSPDRSRVSVSPTETDVLFGRSQFAFAHQGNQAFRSVVASLREEYQSLTDRSHKRRIIDQVYNTIIGRDGRFLKSTDKGATWSVVGRTESYDKISHALRKRELHSPPPSSRSSSCQSSASPLETTSQQESYPPYLSGTQPTVEHLPHGVDDPSGQLPPQALSSSLLIGAAKGVDEDVSSLLLSSQPFPLYSPSTMNDTFDALNHSPSQFLSQAACAVLQDEPLDFQGNAISDSSTPLEPAVIVPQQGESVHYQPCTLDEEEIEYLRNVLRKH